MIDDEERRQRIDRAIRVVAAQVNHDIEQVVRIWHEEGDVHDLVQGLIAVSGSLLLQLARTNGIDPEQLADYMLLRIAQ